MVVGVDVWRKDIEGKLFLPVFFFLIYANAKKTKLHQTSFSSFCALRDFVLEEALLTSQMIS